MPILSVLLGGWNPVPSTWARVLGHSACSLLQHIEEAWLSVALPALTLAAQDMRLAEWVLGPKNGSFSMEETW